MKILSKVWEWTKAVLFGILVVTGIGAYMFFPISRIAIVLFAILTGVYIWLKRRTKQNAFEKQIPEEVLNDLKLAEDISERRLRENGKVEPYDILWEIANSKRGRARIIQTADSRTGESSLSSEFDRREDIQNDSSSISGFDQSQTNGVKRNYNKRIFGRKSRR